MVVPMGQDVRFRTQGGCETVTLAGQFGPVVRGDAVSKVVAEEVDPEPPHLPLELGHVESPAMGNTGHVRLSGRPHLKFYQEVYGLPIPGAFFGLAAILQAGLQETVLQVLQEEYALFPVVVIQTGHGQVQAVQIVPHVNEVQRGIRNGCGQDHGDERRFFDVRGQLWRGYPKVKARRDVPLQFGDLNLREGSVLC
jgi:hypothetical protein